MIILVTGGYGFIGSKITADLITTGNEIICCGKNAQLNNAFFPETKFIYADFSQEISVEEWQYKLTDIPALDCIVNCVGVLQAKEETVWNIHYTSPKNLMTASLAKGLRKVIQISALGIDKIDIPFASSKRALDDFLLALPIDIFVIRPSLVYGQGSFGGTSLFRGLAGLPGFILTPGRGVEKFQPIHLDDLSKAIEVLVTEQCGKEVLTAVGAKQFTLGEILALLRKWLGFGKAMKIMIPKLFIKWAVKIGDIFRTTVNSTLFEMMQQNNVASEKESLHFQRMIGFKPKSFTEMLNRYPSHVQDRWHARLYFLRPLLRFSIAFLWLFTGLTSLFFYPLNKSLMLLHQIGISQPMLFLLGSSLLDFILGLATLLNYRIKLVGTLQIVLILIYTVIITLWLPDLWLNPFGAITKNIPIIVAIAIMIAMEPKR